MTRSLRLLVLALFVTAAATLTASAQDAEVAKAYNEGLALLKEKNWEEAQNAFKNSHTLATQAGEDDVASKSTRYINSLYYNIGVGYISSDPEKALQFFEEGIAAAPDDYKNYKGKATLLKEQGNIEEAMAAYLKTAEVATAAGDVGEASKALAQAEGFAAAELQENNFDQALAYGQQFIDLGQETANIHFYMCHANTQKAQNQTAVGHCSKALELHRGSAGDRAKIAFELASAYENLGDFPRAIEYYKEAAVGPYKQSAEYKIEHLGTVGQ